MKITKTPDMVGAASSAGSAGSIGGVVIGPPPAGPGGGQGIVSSTSNTASWQPIVSTITSNGSNVLLGPHVNFASGSNIVLSVSSNRLNIAVLGLDGNFLVGTPNPELPNEIVVGTTPGGELGGTWANPTVDAVHAGSAHVTAFGGLSDVGITNAQEGDMLRYEGGRWIDTAGFYETVMHDFGSGPEILIANGDIVTEWFD